MTAASSGPACLAELGDAFRRAAATNQALFPLGGHTMLDLGNPPSRPGTGIDLTKLNQVIDYPARDMTITVQAGIRIAELQRILAQEGQQLPIDVPLPEQATLGGAIACNVSGPRRQGYGTLRDYVIGISVMNDEGVETQAGGRVVKNVAGYDLCKLHVGALGTLGIITQVTLKVRPLPETSLLLCVACSQQDLPGLLDQLHASQTRPCATTVLNAHAAKTLTNRNECMLLIGIEETQNNVAWQRTELSKELGHDLQAVDTDVWSWLADFPLLKDAGASIRVSVRPSQIASTMHLLEEMPLAVMAHAATGVLIGHFPPGTSQAEVSQHVASLRRRLATHGGHLVVTRCPDDWKPALDVWGPPGGDWELMRSVKQSLDPKNLFNPGRFVGGI